MTLQSRLATTHSTRWGFGWAPENAVIQVEHGLTASDVWQRYTKAKALMNEEPVRFIVEYDREPVESFSDGLKAAEMLSNGQSAEVEVWIPSKDPDTPWQQMKSDWEGTEEPE